MDIISSIQAPLFEYVALFGTRTSWADPVFLGLSYWIFYVVLGAVFVRIFWKIIHAKSFIEKKKYFLEGLVLIFSVLLTWIFVTLIKVLVAAPRPFEVVEGVRMIYTPYGMGRSFPSGHTAIAAAIAGAIRPYHKHAGDLLLFFALLVGLSRIYLGVHFPIDVVVGFLVGLAISDIVRRIYNML